jgi:hypothetical protein
MLRKLLPPEKRPAAEYFRPLGPAPRLSDRSGFSSRRYHVGTVSRDRLADREGVSLPVRAIRDRGRPTRTPVACRELHSRRKSSVVSAIARILLFESVKLTFLLLG